MSREYKSSGEAMPVDEFLVRELSYKPDEDFPVVDYCPECGAATGPKCKFCSMCGTDLPKEI